jgi:hypothetical protein
VGRGEREKEKKMAIIIIGHKKKKKKRAKGSNIQKQIWRGNFCDYLKKK